MYIQGGVRYRATDGSWIKPPTKKRLKEVAASMPTQVEFYDTSQIDPNDIIRLDQLATDVKLSVVGPDPFTKRTWYATIERTRTGELKVT